MEEYLRLEQQDWRKDVVGYSECISKASWESFGVSNSPQRVYRISPLNLEKRTESHALRSLNLRTSLDLNSKGENGLDKLGHDLFKNNS